MRRLAITVAAVLASVSGAEPVPLEFRPSNVFDAIPASMLMNVIPMTRERPESIIAEPEYANEPLYAQLSLGDGGTVISFALDEDDERAILYIDLNGNGDLTDDEPPEGERAVTPEERRTPQLKVWIYDLFDATIPVRYHDGSELELSITFRTYGKICRDLHAIEPAIVHWSTYYRTGDVRFGEETYAVAVKDQNADGRFDTQRTAARRWGDRVYIDLNRDGLFQTRGEGYEINAPFEVDGRVYEVKGISPSGDWIDIGPTTREFTPDALRVGQMAPDFDIPRVGPLSSLRGRVVLIDFWATWCVPCLSEMPNVVATHERFRSRGFEVVGVSIDRERDAARMHEVAREYAMDWPEVHDHTQAIARQYHVTSIPATFLVGPDGTIRAIGLRGEGLRSGVERAIADMEARDGTQERDPDR